MGISEEELLEAAAALEGFTEEDFEEAAKLMSAYSDEMWRNELAATEEESDFPTLGAAVAAGIVCGEDLPNDPYVGAQPSVGTWVSQSAPDEDERTAVTEEPPADPSTDATPPVPMVIATALDSVLDQQYTAEDMNDWWETESWMAPSEWLSDSDDDGSTVDIVSKSSQRRASRGPFSPSWRNSEGVITTCESAGRVSGEAERSLVESGYDGVRENCTDRQKKDIVLLVLSTWGYSTWTDQAKLEWCMRRDTVVCHGDRVAMRLGNYPRGHARWLEGMQLESGDEVSERMPMPRMGSWSQFVYESPVLPGVEWLWQEEGLLEHRWLMEAVTHTVTNAWPWVIALGQKLSGVSSLFGYPNLRINAHLGHTYLGVYRHQLCDWCNAKEGRDDGWLKRNVRWKNIRSSWVKRRYRCEKRLFLRSGKTNLLSLSLMNVPEFEDVVDRVYTWTGETVALTDRPLGAGFDVLVCDSDYPDPPAGATGIEGKAQAIFKTTFWFHGLYLCNWAWYEGHRPIDVIIDEHARKKFKKRGRPKLNPNWLWGATARCGRLTTDKRGDSIRRERSASQGRLENDDSDSDSDGEYVHRDEDWPELQGWHEEKETFWAEEEELEREDCRALGLERWFDWVEEVNSGRVPSPRESVLVKEMKPWDPNEGASALAAVAVIVGAVLGYQTLSRAVVTMAESFLLKAALLSWLLVSLLAMCECQPLKWAAVMNAAVILALVVSHGLSAACENGWLVLVMMSLLFAAIGLTVVAPVEASEIWCTIEEQEALGRNARIDKALAPRDYCEEATRKKITLVRRKRFEPPAWKQFPFRNRPDFHRWGWVPPLPRPWGE